MKVKALIVVFLLVCLYTGQSAWSQNEEIESLVPKTAPNGWYLKDTPETFDKNTLFEHIDGQADLFIQYGFHKSVFAVYRQGNSSENKIDLDIYDMGNPLQAFGVFSRFRQEESSVGVGLDSYLGDQSAIFYKGRYFVILQATESDDSTLKALARTIESQISDNSPAPKEIEFFPKEGLKPGSMDYFPEGLLGYQFLKKGFKASYQEQGKNNSSEPASDDTDFRLLLSVFEDSQRAIDALELFRDNLSRKGKLEPTVPNQFGLKALTGTDPYQGKIIVVQDGPYLIGAVGFQRNFDAEQRLTEMMKRIK
jgi:hypothetical protein